MHRWYIVVAASFPHKGLVQELIHVGLGQPYLAIGQFAVAAFLVMLLLVIIRTGGLLIVVLTMG